MKSNELKYQVRRMKSFDTTKATTCKKSSNFEWYEHTFVIALVESILSKLQIPLQISSIATTEVKMITRLSLIIKESNLEAKQSCDLKVRILWFLTPFFLSLSWE